MLSKLHIKNYAIIDELEIRFSEGLSIITGETGAGKSILMGALNLVLGQRADSSVLQDREKKCVVEGSFRIISNPEVIDFFSSNDLDPETEIMIRREIGANGKSRSFINDTPVNLAQLKTLAVLLVDLHQQFDTLELNSESFQREVLDAFAGNSQLLQQLKEQFAKYLASKSELEALRLQQANANKELDYNRFLFEELEELSLKENELEDIEAELKLLSNSENVKQQLGSIYLELKDSEQPLVQQLKTLVNRMKPLHEYHAGIEELVNRLQSAAIEIKDVADELERIDDSVNLDPKRIDWINERLSAGYKLLKKHAVSTTSALLEIQSGLQLKLDAVFNISASIEKLDSQTAQLMEESLNTATAISSKRKAQVKAFAEKVNKILGQVGMPNARLKIDIQEAALSASGVDDISFLFDANKSNRFEPISKVASGGELSRLMLAIKSLVATKLELPTLIFDEIDSGISGEAARQVGIIMKELAAKHQLIAITHQAQIAARASAHYYVYKETKSNRIVTSLKRLDNDERIVAIAKMLSGEEPSAAALENAREMVSN